MPCNDVVIVLITFREFGSERARVFPVSRAVRAGVVAAPEFTLHAVKFRPEHIGMFSRHPCRMNGGRSRKADFQAVLLHHVHNFIEFFKGIGILIRLKGSPAEHIQRHDIDMGQFEKPHILFPDIFRPLFGIVIPAI